MEEEERTVTVATLNLLITIRWFERKREREGGSAIL